MVVELYCFLLLLNLWLADGVLGKVNWLQYLLQRTCSRQMEITKSMEPLVQMNQHLRDLKPYFLNFVLALPL
ncbi:hypothetical protein Goklo_002256 [Gossypium klotzschianum]|uniref:Secreted protein n=1 Tax=Gossypium klotzschianum TaxID=34286 RepID=A0A7J8VTN8_9ROSI|nr:hypothetical protein [Gossypium klotzschianum]